MGRISSAASKALLFIAVIAVLHFFGPAAVASVPPANELKEDSRHSPAIDLLKKNDYDGTIRYEDKVIAENPGDLTAYFILTLAYLGKEDERMAAKQAEDVKKIDPAFAAEIYGTIGRYYSSKKRYHKSLVYLHESLKIRDDPAIMKQIASIYLGQGLLKNAREYYERLLDTSPDYLNLGRIELADGNFETAIEYARKAVKEDPRSGGAYLVLGTAYLLTGKTRQAEADFIMLRRLNPEFHLASYFLGMIKLVEQDYDEAIMHFAHLNATLPKLKDSYLNAAAAWHLKGALNKAKDAAVKAIEADPLDPVSHFALGNIYISMKDYDGADDEYHKAEELFPDFGMSAFKTGNYFKPGDRDDVPASLTLAIIFNKAGLYLDSVKAIHSTINSKSLDNPVSLMLMAKAQARLGNFKEAEELCLFLTKVHPELITPLAELGELYESRGETAKAIEFSKKAVLAARHPAGLSLRLADLYSKAGETGKAVAEYKRAILASPQSVYGYHKLAVALAESDDLAEALKYALKGISVNPEDAEMKDALGWVYFKLGKYEEAVGAYSGMTENGGRNPIFYYHLGLALQKLDDLDGARAAFEKALDISEEFPDAPEARRMLDKLSEAGRHPLRERRS